jgi:hypothetical protein
MTERVVESLHGKAGGNRINESKSNRGGREKRKLARTFVADLPAALGSSESTTPELQKAQSRRS